ncbi:MAG: beta-galactosidase [Candidatus Sungbacteria bacterium]|nr:beta-galactosidase [Candidatus Sungbacteria bacterium]
MKYLSLIGLILIAIWFLSRPVPVPDSVLYGVTFSAPYARDTLNLDWKETYIAILDDLGVKHLRIPVYWDEYEPKESEFDFSDLDFMLQEAERRGVDVILAVGEKLPRWPECHIPSWVSEKSRQERHAYLLSFLGEILNRYRERQVLRYWQIENEPFLPFGECKDYDARFIDVEISRFRALDDRPIVVTDSGELSIWAPAYSRSDIFGTTLYRTVWNEFLGNFTYPLRPGYFRMKARLVEMIYGKKPIIIVELQAEPWMAEFPSEKNLNEQLSLMNPEKLKRNVEYARATGFHEVYFWGVEWWYWLKKEHEKPEMWDEAKRLFTMP